MIFKNLYYTKVTLLLAATLTVMAGATIAPSLPQMAKIYDYLPQAPLLTKLILTIPGLFIAIFAPISGAVIDKFGRKKMILGSLLLYGFAGGAGYFIQDLYVLLVSRAILGIAVAGVMTTGSTLIGDYFEGEERNKFMGLQGSFTALGGVVYILLGGFLADVHWKAPFLIYFSAWGILAMAIAYLQEPDKKEVLKHSGASNAAAEPLFNGIRTYGVYILTLLHMIIFYIVPIQIPFYLKQLGITDNKYAGIAIATSTIFAALISLNYPRIKKKLSTQNIYALLFGFNAIGYYIISTAQSLPVLLCGLAITGLGMGLMFPNTTLYLMKITPGNIRGKVMGGFSTAIFIGQFISPLAVSFFTEPYSLQGEIFLKASFVLVGLSIAFIPRWKFNS